MNRISYVLIVLAAILAPTVSMYGQEAEESQTPDAAPPSDAEFIITEGLDPSDWNDPAFSHMVDFELLGAAIAIGDSGTVTDVALQFAHAEEVLLRQHAKVKSDDLLSTAANIAKNAGDKKALARIARAAKSLGNEELAKKIEAAAILGGASRAIDPPPELSIDTDPRVFAEFKDLLDHLEVAENAGDSQGLKSLLIEVRVAELPEKLQKWIEKRIKIALVSENGTDETHGQAMSLLAGASRGGLGNFSLPTPPPIRSPFSFRPQESQSNLGGPSGLVRPQRPQPNRLQRNGYRKYNDVQIGNKGQVMIGGQSVGQARRGRNAQTGKTAWVYQTKRGGTVVRRNGEQQTYVRPAKQQQTYVRPRPSPPKGSPFK